MWLLPEDPRAGARRSIVCAATSLRLLRGEKTQRGRLHLHQKKGGSDGEGEGQVIYSGGPTILGWIKHRARNRQHQLTVRSQERDGQTSNAPIARRCIPAVAW